MLKLQFDSISQTCWPILSTYFLMYNYLIQIGILTLKWNYKNYLVLPQTSFLFSLLYLCCVDRTIIKMRLLIPRCLFLRTALDPEKSLQTTWMDDPCNLRCFIMFVLWTWNRLYQTKHGETNFIETRKGKNRELTRVRSKNFCEHH